MSAAEKIPLVVPDLIHNRGTVFDQTKGSSFIQTNAAYMLQTMVV